MVKALYLAILLGVVWCCSQMTYVTKLLQSIKQLVLKLAPPGCDVFYGGTQKRKIKSSYSSLAAVLADLFWVEYACIYLVKWSTMTNMYS